jgi:hypothetical protein
MRFPQLARLRLPATFERYMAGRPHPDGRRYLPLLILEVGASAPLGVVDRHHLVPPEWAGRRGTARLVFLLSTISLQPAGQQRQELVPEIVLGGRASTMPELYGRVVEVPTWEETRGALQFESLYTEFLLDIGLGTVGVRTATTAGSLEDILGKARLESGDWVHVSRSRVDILGFEPE